MKLILLMLSVKLLVGCDSPESNVPVTQELKDNSHSIVSEVKINKMGCFYAEDMSAFSCRQADEPVSDYNQFVTVTDYYRSLQTKIEDLNSDTNVKSAQEEYDHLLLIDKSLKVYFYISIVFIKDRSYEINKFRMNMERVFPSQSVHNNTITGKLDAESIYVKQVWSQMKDLYFNTGIRFTYDKLNNKLEIVKKSVPVNIDQYRAQLESSIKSFQFEDSYGVINQDGEAYGITLQYITWLELILADKI